MSGAVLLEREDELVRLDELIEAARAGRGAVTIVEGPAGIGKSVLLAATRERAGEQGFTVLSARGGTLEREHPFGVARQLLGPLPAGRRARTSTRTASAQSSAELMFDALEEMYGELVRGAGDGALLVSVDDAHWADVESLRLCAYLAARIDSLSALLVLAARSVAAGDARELLATIAAGASILHPRPLSVAGVAGFVGAEMEATPAQEFIGACSHLSGGNPFLLAELVRTARSEAIEPVAGNSQRVRALTPAGVAHAVLVRLAQLPPDAHQLARAIAVLGGSAQLREVAALAEIELAAAASAADALIAAEVLARSQPLEFVHPLIRNVVYEDLPPSERQASHLRAARLLEADPSADPDRVAAHLLAVEPAGDRWVARELVLAGTRALERGGCDAAAVFLRRALQEPAPAGERPELLLSLAQAEAAGGSGDAVVHLQAALDLIEDSEERARLSQSLGRLFFLRGEFELAGETAKRALAELPDESGPLARQLLADYLAAVIFHPRLRTAADAPGAALVAEVLAGQLPPEPQLCAQVAGALAFLGAPAEQVRDAASAAMSRGIVEQESSQGLAASFAAGALSAVGEYQLAEDTLRDALDSRGQSGASLPAAQADQVMANIRWRQGRLADAVAHAQAALALHDAGWSFLLGLAAPTMAFAELERGQLAGARAAVELSERELTEERPEFNLVLVARGRLAFAEGSFERALTDLQLVGQRTLEMFGRPERPDILSWRPYAALAAQALERPGVRHRARGRRRGASARRRGLALEPRAGAACERPGHRGRRAPAGGGWPARALARAAGARRGAGRAGLPPAPARTPERRAPAAARGPRARPVLWSPAARRAAGRVREDGRSPRLRDPPEARRPQPRRGGRRGAAARLDRRLSSPGAAASGGLKVCVPEEEATAIVTPANGTCKAKYALTELGAEGREGKQGLEGKEGAPGKEGPAGKEGKPGKQGPKGKRSRRQGMSGRQERAHCRRTGGAALAPGHDHEGIPAPMGTSSATTSSTRNVVAAVGAAERGLA